MVLLCPVPANPCESAVAATVAGFGSRFHSRPALERQKMVSCCTVGEFAKVIASDDGLSGVGSVGGKETCVNLTETS